MYVDVGYVYFCVCVFGWVCSEKRNDCPDCSVFCRERWVVGWGRVNDIS